MLIQVEGGTNAGRKLKRELPKSWACNCYDEQGGNAARSITSWRSRTNPSYLSRCNDCGAKRP